MISLIKILFILIPLLGIFNNQHIGLINIVDGKGVSLKQTKAEEKNDGFDNLPTNVLGQNSGNAQGGNGKQNSAGAKPSSSDSFENLPTGRLEELGKNLSIPKLFYYDEFGNLIVNGFVAGISKPIVLDYKKYWIQRGPNVHFFFSFQFPGQELVDAVEEFGKKANLSNADKTQMLSSCPYGITFCYEGQLDGPSIREEFRVSNFISNDISTPSQKIGLQCMLARNSPNAHGFNVAVVAFTNLNGLIIDKKRIWRQQNEVWRFLVFTMSIVEKEYYFVLPRDGKVMLQIGDRLSLDSYLIDSQGNPLKSAYIYFSGKWHGYEYPSEIYETMPGPQEYFSKNPNFWMLYLDFKSSPREMQIIQTIHSEDCHMKVQINGNKMRKCRTFFEDLAVTEPSNVEMDLMYTYELGNIQRNDHGQEDLQELVKKFAKEQMEKNIRKEASRKVSASEEKNSNASTESKAREDHSSSGLAGGIGTGGGLYFNKSPLDDDVLKKGPGGTEFREKANEVGTGKQQQQKFFDNFNQMGDMVGAAELHAMGPLPEEKKKEVEKTKDGLGIFRDIGANAIRSWATGKLTGSGGGGGGGGDGGGGGADNSLAGSLLKTDSIGTVFQGLIDGNAGGGGGDVSGLLGQLGSAEKMLEEKSGLFSLSVGNLVMLTQSDQTGLFSEMGQDLADIANSGGSEKIEEWTALMQNLIPPSMGGSLISSEAHMNLMNPVIGFNNWIEGPPKLPTDGIHLSSGLTLTNDLLQNWPKEAKIPSSWSPLLKGQGIDIDTSKWWFDNIRATSGDVFQNPLTKHADVNPTNFLKRHKRQFDGFGGGGGGGGGGEDGGGDGGDGGKGRPDYGQLASAVGLEGSASWRIGLGGSTEKWEQSGSANREHKFYQSSSRTFSDVSAAKSLMESFKQTSGISDSLTTSDFAQYSQAFTQKETVDIHVSDLPKNTKIVISQLIFECDGAMMKLPAIFFHNGSELIKGFTQNAVGSILPSMAIGGIYETKGDQNDKPSEGNKVVKRSTNHQMMHDGHGENHNEMVEVQQDFENAMLEYSSAMGFIPDLGDE